MRFLLWNFGLNEHSVLQDSELNLIGLDRGDVNGIRVAEAV